MLKPRAEASDTAARAWATSEAEALAEALGKKGGKKPVGTSKPNRLGAEFGKLPANGAGWAGAVFTSQLFGLIKEYTTPVPSSAPVCIFI